MIFNPIIVTREEDPADGPLGQALRKAGLEPRHVPLIASRRRQPDDPLLNEAIEALRQGAWINFTSRRAVDFWFDAMAERGLSPETFQPAGPVRTIGASTAGAIRERGWNVVIDENAAMGNKFGDAMKNALNGLRDKPVVIFPRAAEIASDWPLQIESLVSKFLSPVMYDTLPIENDLTPVIENAASGQIDAITFASPSAVESFVMNLQRLNLAWDGRCLLAAIGPTTVEALHHRNLSPAWKSPTPLFSGFAASLLRELNRSRSL